jgi:ribonuclease R
MAKQNNQPLPLQILSALQGAKDSMSSSELLDALYLSKKDKDALYKALDALTEQNLIERLRGNRYQATKAANRKGPFLYKGTFSAHPKGFGFFMPIGPANEEDLIPPLKEDAFVPPPARRGALHGDAVTALVSRGSDGRFEATIASVMSRARTRFSGILRREGAKLYVEPEDGRLPGPIYVDKINVTPEPLPGQAVIVEMTQYPRGEDLHMKGNIVFLHEDQSDPRTEVDRLIALHNLPSEFPADVQQEATSTPQEVKAEDFPDRLDLRQLPLVTIDGEDARDFDDAVAVIELTHGYELTVAVADVSHYVRVGSALDREAFERGTSVYFPDRVIPMLPHALSNGICSLNPAVNRLCMVAIIELDKQGRTITTRFDKAIMNSHGRLTYEAVSEVLDDKPGWSERHPALVQHKERLHLMSRLAQILRANRTQRGSLDFDLPEAQIVFDRSLEKDHKADAKNLIKDIIERPRTEAHKLIEDFMLAANEAVAQLFTKHNIQAPYRIHEPPDLQKLETFAQLSNRLGQPLEIDEEITPKQLGVYLASLEAKPALAILHQLLLRSLKQAKYSTQNVGHFGLAAKDYLHFTSPIRRYPDLIVHRVLSSFLGQKKGFAPATRLAPIKDLEAVSVQSSQRERRSFEAERDVDDMWRAYYMNRHIGELFDGKISGVTKNGFFVTIPKPYVDGFVRAESLPGMSFSLDENGIQLISGSGYAYSLGDDVRVKVVRTSWRERKIDLELAAHDAKLAASDKPKQKRGATSSRESTPPNRNGRPNVSERGAKGPQRGKQAQGNKGRSTPKQNKRKNR